MEDIENINDGFLTFEDFKNTNGIIYWWASELMIMLGYPNMKSFQNVLDRATKAMVSINIPHYENIIPVQREKEGNVIQDFKLTRFACYMCSMNGNPKKPEVAIAQAYFAQQTRKFELYFSDGQEIDRLLIRDELADGNKSLASVATSAGVVDHAKFQNAGYLGMYNMESWKLARKRGIDKKKIFDSMGRTELAANLFRVTQTEERIKNYNVQGQAALERTHYDVGKEVRGIIIKNVGKAPESMEQEKELPVLKKELKEGYKKMGDVDKKSGEPKKIDKGPKVN